MELQLARLPEHQQQLLQVQGAVPLASLSARCYYTDADNRVLVCVCPVMEAALL